MRPLYAILFAFLAGNILAQTGTVADRTTLNGILGGSAYTETFSGYPLSSGSALYFPAITTLNSTTLINSYGPGLVGPGVTFSDPADPGAGLQWDNTGYFTAASPEVLFNQGHSITITFAVPTIAFGADVRDFNSNTMTATIFGADHTTVLATLSGINLSSNSVFLGYQASGGIGQVTLTETGSWSPLVSNLTFAAVPEPSPGLLLGSGTLFLLIGAWRRGRQA